MIGDLLYWLRKKPYEGLYFFWGVLFSLMLSAVVVGLLDLLFHPWIAWVQCVAAPFPVFPDCKMPEVSFIGFLFTSLAVGIGWSIGDAIREFLTEK